MEDGEMKDSGIDDSEIGDSGMEYRQKIVR